MDQHLYGQINFLSDADGGQTRPHHINYRELHDGRVAIDGVHQLELIHGAGHFGVGERGRVLAHR